MRTMFRRLTNAGRNRETGKRHERPEERVSRDHNPHEEKLIEKLELSDLDHVLGGWSMAA